MLGRKNDLGLFIGHQSSFAGHQTWIDRATKNCRFANWGTKVGICMPVLCEIEAGIQQLNRPDDYRRELDHLLRQVQDFKALPDISTANWLALK